MKKNRSNIIFFTFCIILSCEKSDLKNIEVNSISIDNSEIVIEESIENYRSLIDNEDIADDFLLEEAYQFDTEDLVNLIIEFEQFFNNGEEIVVWENLIVLFTLHYEGGDALPADMYFFTNNIMVVNSEFFSESKENRFFKYFLNNNQLELISIDTRMNTVWLDVAYWHMENGRGIISVDKIKRSVIYNFERPSINFGGWIFYNSSEY